MLKLIILLEQKLQSWGKDEVLLFMKGSEKYVDKKKNTIFHHCYKQMSKSKLMPLLVKQSAKVYNSKNTDGVSPISLLLTQREFNIEKLEALLHSVNTGIFHQLKYLIPNLS